MIAIAVPGGGQVDHIVLGVADSAAGVEFVAELTGVRALPASVATPTTSPTRSAGVHLGGQRFLEIYAPNVEYDGPTDPMATFLATLDAPRVLTWFARVTDLDAASRAFATAGEEFRSFMDVTRDDAPSFRNGHLTSELFNPSIPFLIEWRDRLDMDERMAHGCELLEARVTAKSPQRTQAMHTLLGLDLPIDTGDADAFTARLSTPNGEVALNDRGCETSPVFDTKALPGEADVVAPDGSDVRILLGAAGGTMAQFELAANAVSVVVRHRTIDEIWYFLSGRGEMWRRAGREESTVEVAPGDCLTIPRGTEFQFRSFAREPLTAVGVAMPPWPGEGEAIRAAGPWTATVEAGPGLVDR